MTLSGARSALEACSESYKIFWLDVLQQQHDAARSPTALKKLGGEPEPQRLRPAR